jgi:hypothetical protein
LGVGWPLAQPAIMAQKTGIANPKRSFIRLSPKEDQLQTKLTK